jgi:hypothetical protein
MVISFDPNILLGYYQAKAAQLGASAVGGSVGATGASGSSTKVAPTAPWTQDETPQQASANVSAALAGRKFIDENAAKLDLPGASADYKKLFALYQGISTLNDLAERAKTAGVSNTEKTQLQKAFASGMAEVSAYIGSSNFDKLRLAQGDVDTSDKATLTVAKTPTQYVTAPLGTTSSGEIAALQGDIRFNIHVTRLTQSFDVPIDLSAMPDQTRSLANVIGFINDQLQAAGVDSRFGTSRIPGQAQQIKAGSNTVTLPAGPDQWALKITVGAGETLDLSSPQTAGAVYVAQQVGESDPDHNGKTDDSTVQQQLLKFQTDTDALDAPQQVSGQANWVDGRVFSQNLDKSVGTVHAQTVGPDGSVYMIADVTGKTDGQAIRGDQDVALLKYDAAGNLVYTRTLGAASSATGLSVAVSADGKQIAVGGSVSGDLDGSTDGALNSGSSGAYANQPDSFVTLFNDTGDEIWTQRRGARQDDQVNQLAFGADGTLYVAGQTKSAMPGGGTAQGDWDGYVEAFSTDAKGKATTLFTQDFGAAGPDKPKGLVVDGNALVVASNESGRAVLRRFDLSSGAPVEVANRDLGDLQGGDIAGLALDANGQLVIAGTTSNQQLSIDSVTSPASGGTDAFAARIAADLSVSASDRLAYYGGSGNDKATAMAVADGKVWIAGTAGADLPGQAPVGTQDGFLANIDVDTGAVDWSRRFTGTSQHAAPTAIAVDTSGASVLDRLGLPTGELGFDNSEQLSSVSSLRAGDQFTVAGNGMPGKTVTIDPGETLDTLRLKIQRASNFSAKVTVVSTADDQHQLKIEPAYNGAVVTFGPGKGDKNALPLLGIPEGVVRATTTSKDGTTSPADGKPTIYGLSLDSTLNISDDAQLSHALAVLSNAQVVIRSAYKDLVKAATPKSQQNAAAAAASAGSGSVPAYMTAQIANYQAALDRLTGGSSAATGVTDPAVALLTGTATSSTSTTSTNPYDITGLLG